MTQLALAKDAIPMVMDATERGLAFPAPNLNQRVHNLTTNAIERWNGASWVQDFVAGGGAGGSSVGDVVSVKDFGAVGDGLTDDSAAIQAAIDSVYNAAGKVRKVYFPNAVAAAAAGVLGNVGQGAGYRISRPIFLRNRAGMGLLGTGQNFNQNYAPGSEIWPTFRYGPAIVVDDGRRALDLVPALVGGVGNALRRSDTWVGANEKEQFFELRDAATMELHGLNQLCVEMWYAGTETDGTFIWSIGRWRMVDQAATPTGRILEGALCCGIKSGYPFFRLRTTAGVLDLAADVTGDLTAKINSGAPTHVRWSWDGANYRLFVNGVLKQTQAHAGTIIQDVAEEVNFGAHFMVTPRVSLFATTPTGTYDSIRISNVARSVVDFALPAAKWVNDGNTLMLLNFDENIGPLTKAYTKDGDAWLYYAGPSEPVGGGATASYLHWLNGWTIEGIAILGGIDPGTSSWHQNRTSGIYIASQSSYNGKMADVSIQRARYGIKIGGTGGNAYGGRFERVHVTAFNGRGAYWGANLAGLASFRDCWFTGGRVPFMSGAGGLSLDNCHIIGAHDVAAGDTGSIFCMFLRGDDGSAPPTVLNRCSFDGEAGVEGGVFKSTIALEGTQAGVVLRAHGTQIAQNPDPATDTPFIRLSGKVAVVFDTCPFERFTEGIDTQIVLVEETAFIAAQLRYPVAFRNCTQSGAPADFVPWCVTRGGATAEVPGVRRPAATELDCSVASVFDVLLAGGFVYTLINITEGQRVTLIFRQDAAGGHVVTHPANVKGADAVGAAANAVTVQEFVGELGDIARATGASKVS